MRRAWCLLGVVLLLAGVLFSAPAEGLKAPDYLLEGYDGDGAGHDWETNLFFQRMQERTGISFQFRQYTEEEAWAARKEELLAGEDLPDALFKAGLTEEETRKMAEAGVLIDLTPYLEEDAPDLWALLEANPEYRAAITLPDGTIRALPGINELPQNNLIWMNQTWLNNLRMEMPTTAEELTEVLRAFRDQDPNRNGRADEVPLSALGMWDLRFLAHAFGIIDNDYYLSLREGQAVSALTSEENRAFLSWLHQLWEEGLLSHQTFQTLDTLRQVTDGNAEMTYGLFLSSSPLTVVPAEAAGNYTALTPLEYQGERVYRDLLGPLSRGAFAITSACREPERLVSWANQLYTEEVSLMMQVGLEGEEYLWTEEGTWEWMADLQTVASQILPEATLADGGVTPGLISRDFQRQYNDRATQRLVEDMIRVQEYARLPFPQVILSGEDAAQVRLLQQELAPWAEGKMAEFVTGDLALDDAGWAEFTEGLERRGLGDMLAIWQKYVPEE